MADVTCEVIKDLIPLYVDDVLSEDSKALVEEHILICPECAEICKTLKESENTRWEVAGLKAKEAIKKIREKINIKRVIAIVITAACIISLFGGLYYYFFVHEIFIPYEEAKLYVKGDAICTELQFRKSSGFYSSDGKTFFFYMYTTFYEEKAGKGLPSGMPILSLTEEKLTQKTYDYHGNFLYEKVCKEIYYLPNNEIIKNWKDEDITREQWYEKLKSESYLVWSAD